MLTLASITALERCPISHAIIMVLPPGSIRIAISVPNSDPVGKIQFKVLNSAQQAMLPGRVVYARHSRLFRREWSRVLRRQECGVLSRGSRGGDSRVTSWAEGPISRIDILYNNDAIHVILGAIKLRGEVKCPCSGEAVTECAIATKTASR